MACLKDYYIVLYLASVSEMFFRYGTITLRMNESHDSWQNHPRENIHTANFDKQFKQTRWHVQSYHGRYKQWRFFKEQLSPIMISLWWLWTVPDEEHCIRNDSNKAKSEDMSENTVQNIRYLICHWFTILLIIRKRPRVAHTISSSVRLNITEALTEDGEFGVCALQWPSGDT